MSAAVALTGVDAVMHQVDRLREEEAADDSWFGLPEDGDDSVNWKSFQCEIQGPDSYTVNPTGDKEDRASPYKGGVFRVVVTVTDAFPMEAPTFVFRTRVFHPNINLEKGEYKPCISGLQEAWKPTSTVKDVLLYARNLLAQPNGADHINADAAALFNDKLAEFEARAASETATYAS